MTPFTVFFKDGAKSFNKMTEYYHYKLCRNVEKNFPAAEKSAPEIIDITPKKRGRNRGLNTHNA